MAYEGREFLVNTENTRNQNCPVVMMANLKGLPWFESLFVL